MSDNKKVYMQLGDDNTQEHEYNTASKGTEFAKDEIKEELAGNAIEGITEKLLEGVEMLQVGSGMVSVAMPLVLFNAMAAMFKQLENEIQIDGGISR